MLNLKEVELHLQKILQADKTIYETFLGLEWKTPTKRLLRKDHFLPPRTNFNTNNIDYILLKCPRLSLEPENKQCRISGCVKNALIHYGDFLSDLKIHNLLQSYGEETETLVKLNNVIEYLDVKSMEDVNMIVDFLKPFMYCAQCKDELAQSDKMAHARTKEEVLDKEHNISAIACIHSRRMSTITPFISHEEYKLSSDTSIILPEISPPPRNISRETKTTLKRAKSLTDIFIQSNVSFLVDTMSNVDDQNKFKTEYVDIDSEFKTEFSYSINWTEKNTMNLDGVNLNSVTLIGDLVEEMRDQTIDRRQVKFCEEERLVSFTCANETHKLNIKSIDVLKAIQQFIREYKSQRVPQTQPTDDIQDNFMKVKRIDKSDVDSFWNQFLEIFLGEKLDLWNSAFKSLEKYYKLLVNRCKLNEELACISSRRNHLRTLLQSYIEPEMGLGTESLPPIHDF